jgi:hypothetical protein
VRKKCKEVDKAYDKTEDNLKALPGEPRPPPSTPALLPPAMLTAVQRTSSPSEPTASDVAGHVPCANACGCFARSLASCCGTCCTRTASCCCGTDATMPLGTVSKMYGGAGVLGGLVQAPSAGGAAPNNRRASSTMSGSS